MSEKKTRYDLVYGQVMALYTALREANEFRVRRAEMRQGEVKAEPIDFCADVDVKAVRALFGDGYAITVWHSTVEDPEQYPRVPVVIRELLGEAFDKGKLGPTGDYRALYARLGDKA